MIKSAFMLGAGMGLIGGMFLVKMCPKAEKAVDDIKAKASNAMNKSNGCDCGCNNGENNCQ